jgi:hypothetical protein
MRFERRLYTHEAGRRHVSLWRLCEVRLQVPVLLLLLPKGLLLGLSIDGPYINLLFSEPLGDST